MKKTSMKRLSVADYFRLPETLQPMELDYGVVREPPAPRYGHQSIVTRLTAVLDQYVREHHLGVVCVSPMDVVLDRPAALVVQPDILFVAADRRHIVRDRVWGAPDLVVEVLSPSTARRDRQIKLAWYTHYGVREAWLVDPRRHTIEVHDLTKRPPLVTRYSGTESVRSRVLRDWELVPDAIFR